MKNIQISILDTSTSNLDLELSSINVENNKDLEDLYFNIIFVVS